ncbi:hypothetical protein NLJ89_g7948 [Agrocybe chaxingu]|uniref:Fungal-type protein kinase domain-containing protein n=1 Tax=Agrocybe chaxingu TaxID=84603 RepID=A0A9W8JYA3_9AGAR|nr:hypothetical protein NLJ89_g7948 [Agrocybe chaxingu]
MTEDANVKQTRAAFKSVWEETGYEGFSFKAPYELFISRFGSGLPSRDEISAFLRDTELFNNEKGKWPTIPEDMCHKDLVLEIQRIMNEVFVHFKYSGREIQALRQESVAVNLPLEGKSDKAWNVQMAPDLIITGEGWAYHPRFEGEERDSALWATHMQQTCSVVVVRTTEDLEDPERDLQIDLEASFFAQQCFYHQGHRIFCFVLVVAAGSVQLLYYDRGGTLCSPLTSIHDFPEHFIWYILLVSSTNDEILGFDETIRWDSETKTRTLTTVNEAGNKVQYPLKCSEPIFRSDEIKGRITTCWEVEGENGERLIVRDAWREDNSEIPPEWALREHTKGIRGVGQIIAYESDCNLSTLRYPFSHPDFKNHIRLRTTMKAYGKTIDCFENREQLLYAFRDAVAGHRRLWEQGILHRDISANNILLGNSDAQVGDRGIIIDFETAIRLEPEQPFLGKAPVGTVPFTSTKILTMALTNAGLLPSSRSQGDFHTHLDDLWSFFYVLCWCCFAKKGDPKAYRRLLNEWGQDAEESLRSKREFHDSVHYGYYRSSPHSALFSIDSSPLYALIWTILSEGSIDCHAKKHYDIYLEIIDKAIVAMEEEIRCEDGHVRRVEVTAKEPGLPTSGETKAAPLGDIPLNIPNGKRKRDMQDEGEQDIKDDGKTKARKDKKIAT